MTALSDLRLAAQQRADRVNASTITTAEWNAMINASAAALYRALTSTYEDYNVTSYDFTLAGGVGGNSITLGYGTSVPAFDKLRGLWKQLGVVGSGPFWGPLLKLNSFNERNIYAAPPINPIYGNLSVYYSLMGSTLEVLPPDSSAGTYRLWYVPVFTKLVNDTDVIDGMWLATNGCDEWIVVDVARKALLKEESLDTAAMLAQECESLKATILKELSPRDDNSPGKIADMKRLRANWGYAGWGSGGMGG